MSWFGSDKPDPKQQQKNAKREVRGGQRDMEREIRRLDREEKKAVIEARNMMKRGDAQGAKMIAKNIVQIRNAKNRMRQTKTQLSSVNTRITTMGSQATMAKAMATAGSAMHVANQQMDPRTLSKIMRNFEQQGMKMEMTDEMMDDLFADDGVDEMADAHLAEIFESIGVESTMGLESAPQHAVGQQQNVMSDAQANAEADRLMKELLSGN